MEMLIRRIKRGRIGYVTPRHFGCRGNGANDSARLNAAVLHASQTGKELIIPSGTFGLSGILNIPAGVARIRGDGGVIRCLVAAESGLLLDHPTDLAISGLTVDANGQNTNIVRGIHAIGPVGCEFIGINILNLRKNLSSGILLSYGSRPATNNAIIGANITGSVTTQERVYAIDLVGEINLGGYAYTSELWVAEHRPPDVVMGADDTTIEDCTVDGCYYGASLIGSSGNTIRRNSFRNNVRGMSIQSSSSGNIVTDNLIEDCLSSGIHLAYGSCDNVIERNDISTGRAIGEGLLQAYVGSSRNVFAHNITRCPGPSAGAKYHAYTAVQCDANVFDSNAHYGRCSKAYVGIESAWNSTVANTAHRNFGLGAVNDGYAAGGQTGAVVQGVTIVGDSAVPAVFVSAIDDAVHGSTSNTGVLLDDLLVSGAALPVEIYEMTGDVSGSGSSWPA